LCGNTTANANTAIGREALRNNTTASNNTAVGYQSLCANTTGFSNTALGDSALRCNTTAIFNTAVGKDALTKNTTGTQNTGIGRAALICNTTGGGNTALGIESLYCNTTGDNNVAIGANTLFQNTGSCNTALGLGAGSTVTTGSNLTLLGYNAQPSSATATNEITFGDANITCLRSNTTTISSLSDRRDKSNICQLQVGLNFVKDLQPVTFDWTRRDGTMKGHKDMGFIAQDLDELQQKYNIEEHLKIVLKSNPERLEASPGKLIPILVQAIKDLTKEVDTLKEEVKLLKS